MGNCKCDNKHQQANIGHTILHIMILLEHRRNEEILEEAMMEQIAIVMRRL